MNKVRSHIQDGDTWNQLPQLKEGIGTSVYQQNTNEHEPEQEYIHILKKNVVTQSLETNKIALLGTIDTEFVSNNPDFMYWYQRLLNNLIGAIGIIYSPDVYYPYINWDKSGNIFLDKRHNYFTAIDIKTIDIAYVRKKITDLLQSTDEVEIQEKLRNLSKQVEKNIINYFRYKQACEVEQGKRHALYMKFVPESTKGKRVMETLYNILGPKRMSYFDYNPETKVCTLNTEGKKRLLDEFIQEIDYSTKYRFINIENIFPGADYLKIKNKNITLQDVTTENIIGLAEYLLIGHHSIDDLAERQKNKSSHHKYTTIISPIKDILKNILQIVINKNSKSLVLKPVFNETEAKEYKSKLKTSRGLFIERIIIANTYLQNIYDFAIIDKVYQTFINELQSRLYKAFSGYIQHIKIRKKSKFSATNKILRNKEIDKFRDMIGLQIYVDTSEGKKAEIIQQIFSFINNYLHNTCIKQTKLRIKNIRIDNKNMLTPDVLEKLIEDIRKNKLYPVQARKKNTHTNMQNTTILNINKGKTGSNGEWQDIKEIIEYEVYDKQIQKVYTQTSGIEIQILPYGKSVNQNEGAHQFLDAQKAIDMIINTNAVCPRSEYCRIKEEAITQRASELYDIAVIINNQTMNKNTKRKLTEYTLPMREKERWYTIQIKEYMRPLLKKITEQKDYLTQNIIQIKEGQVYIDLLQLTELSSNIYKRLAADVIILHQVNTELQSGKLIQYRYHTDIKSETRYDELKNYIYRDKPCVCTYPRIQKLQRDEKSYVKNNGIYFVNSSSIVRIQTAQIPKDALIIIPDEQGVKGYVQNVANIAYDSKEENVITEIQKT